MRCQNNLKPCLLLFAAMGWLLGAGQGCLNTTPPGVLFASQPAGAKIVLDENDSGFVTPTLLSLERDKAYEVRLELQGYEPRTLRVEPGHRVLIIPWSDAVIADGVQFPLFATTEDLFFPRRVDDSHVPGRVFVRMRPLGVE